MLERAARLQLQRVGQRLGGHVGVAVAVAADPVAHAEERRQPPAAAVGAREQLIEFGFQLKVKPRHFAEEGAVVVRKRVLDFVGHSQLGEAQQPRLPQLGDARAQLGFDLAQPPRRLRLVAFGEQSRDHAFGVEQALALHFGRVRGQHRRDQRVGEYRVELTGVVSGVAQLVQRGAHAARLRAVAGELVGAAPAQHVAVLGDVGQDREIAEGADHADRVVARELLQRAVEVAAQLGFAVAVVADRELADALDGVEHRFALLLADHVAEQPAEQPDVVEQRGVGGRIGAWSSHGLRRVLGFGSGGPHRRRQWSHWGESDASRRNPRSGARRDGAAATIDRHAKFH
ncbi:hypothetical protein GALL_466410 [mine drainage metagenome]|uniref:Uncharacterized protein n=1 Tax=mine drainage metagenome TaxID=410659 RepID=A0A1J5PKS2_9ZZZZ